MTKEIVTAVAASAVLSEIYRDIVQPSAKRVGTSLETLTKITVSPIALIDWGFEKSADWLRRKIEDRMSATPSEFLVEPKANILYEALSHIAISHDIPELRDLYAELLLKAMDARTANMVHPAYFHVIEQLASQEALVLVGLHTRPDQSLFIEKIGPWDAYDREGSVEGQFATFCAETASGSTHEASVWLTNLCRLGLLSLQSWSEAVFRPEEASREGIREAQVENYEHRSLEFTEFGKAFIAACAPESGDTESMDTPA